MVNREGVVKSDQLMLLVFFRIAPLDAGQQAAGFSFTNYNKVFRRSALCGLLFSLGVHPRLAVRCR